MCMKIVLGAVTCQSLPSLHLFASRLTGIARDRLRFYLTQDGYDSFQKLECSENGIIQSLIDLMQFEDDDLQVSSCKLLFAIFDAEKALFSKAKSSYLYTSNSQGVFGRMVKLATLGDGDKVLLRMLQGHAESGEECICILFPVYLT